MLSSGGEALTWYLSVPVYCEDDTVAWYLFVPVYCEDDTVASYLSVPVYQPTEWLIMLLKPTKMSQTKLWFMWDKDTLYPTKHHTSQCMSKQRHSYYTQARWRWVVIFISTALPLGKSLRYSSGMKLGKTQNQYEWCSVETNLLPVAQPAFHFACGPVHETALSRLQCFSSKLKSNNWPEVYNLGCGFLHDTASTEMTITTMTKLQAAHQNILAQFLARARDLSLLQSLQIGSVDHSTLYSLQSDSSWSMKLTLHFSCWS